MSIKESHRQRVEKIRAYVSSNRLFLAMAALVIILLLSGTSVFQRKENNSNPDEPAQIQETDETGWRFYPIDGVILLVGGSICIVQIWRERKKGRRN